jgi:hypothetical protein
MRDRTGLGLTRKDHLSDRSEARSARPIAEVLDGARFKDGIRVTDDDNDNDEMTDERVAV